LPTFPAIDSGPLPRTLLLIVLIVAGGCGTQSLERVAASKDLTLLNVDGDGFSHMIARRWSSPASDQLHIYIEGDGIPWVGHYPSSDPTPRNMLALRLATIDPGDIVYLGRPCYFGNADAEYCHPKYWTSHRYGEAVLRSMAVAIESVREPRHENIILVGHSGGGVLAALLESRVNGVVGVVSIGANLDIDKWADWHSYDRLQGSLNPVVENKDRDIRHLQLVGGRDTTVPSATSAAFSRTKPNVEMVVYPDFDHVCCWEEEWPNVLRDFQSGISSNQSPTGY
jgi:pimeloyl-ACP methyl ester carboxylesterase